MIDFPVYGDTDKPVTSVLPSGRYRFAVKEITDEDFEGEKIISEKGNYSVQVILEIEGRRVKDYICISAGADWRWREFLYAIHIRQVLGRGQSTHRISDDEIIGKEGMVDIVESSYKDKRSGEDIPCNKVRLYTALDSETAPIKGVPPENEVGDALEPPEPEEPKAEAPKPEKQKTPEPKDKDEEAEKGEPEEDDDFDL